MWTGGFYKYEHLESYTWDFTIYRSHKFQNILEGKLSSYIY